MAGHTLPCVLLAALVMSVFNAEGRVIQVSDTENIDSLLHSDGHIASTQNTSTQNTSTQNTFTQNTSTQNTFTQNTASGAAGGDDDSMKAEAVIKSKRVQSATVENLANVSSVITNVVHLRTDGKSPKESTHYKFEKPAKNRELTTPKIDNSGADTETSNTHVQLIKTTTLHGKGDDNKSANVSNITKVNEVDTSTGISVNRNQDRTVQYTFSIHIENLKRKLHDLEKKIQRLNNERIRSDQGENHPASTYFVMPQIHANEAEGVARVDDVHSFQSEANKLKHTLNVLDTWNLVLRKWSPLETQQDTDESFNSAHPPVSPSASLPYSSVEPKTFLSSEAGDLNKQLLQLDTMILKLSIKLQQQQKFPYIIASGVKDTSGHRSSGQAKVGQLKLTVDVLNQRLLEVNKKIVKLAEHEENNQIKQYISNKNAFKIIRKTKVKFPDKKMSNVNSEKQVLGLFSSEANNLKERLRHLNSVIVRMETELEEEDNNLADELSRKEEGLIPVRSNNNKFQKMSVRSADNFLSLTDTIMQQLNQLDDKLLGATIRMELQSQHGETTLFAKLHEQRSRRSIGPRVEHQGSHMADRVFDMVTLCSDDVHSPECELFRENLPSSLKEASLDNSHMHVASLHRKKRETSNQVNNRQPNEDTNEGGSGEPSVLYEDSKSVQAELIFNMTTMFNLTSESVTNLTETNVIEQITIQIHQAFENVPGDTTVIISKVTIDQTTGQVTVAWNTKTIPPPEEDIAPDSLFAKNTPNEFEDGLASFVRRDVVPVLNTLHLLGYQAQNITADEIEQLIKTSVGMYDDPCSKDDGEPRCERGYSNCTRTEFKTATCAHKCALFQDTNQCTHSSVCELDKDFKPFCACGKNWEGELCENKKTQKSLSPAEVTGVTIGGLLMVIGLVGSCCWLVLCRKGDKNVKYTDYSDDVNGSDNFSSPSSKLAGFVIDRPNISVDPVHVFVPSNHYSNGTGSDSRSSVSI